MSTKKSNHRKRRAPRVRRASKPGALPGTIKPAAGSPAPVMRVVTYGPHEFKERTIDDLDQLQNLLGRFPVTWINVDGLGDAATIRRLGEIFNLHPLALEDVVNVHQRAKVEEYGEHLFIVVRMVSCAEHLECEQLSMFLGKGFVLTFQERPGVSVREVENGLDPVRERLRKGRGRIRSAGADYLAYALVDAVVDCYFPIIDDYGDQLESLDEQIPSHHATHTIEKLHALRGDLMTLRRAIRPLRDALVKLMPDPTSLISEETQFHLRDCYDHVIQLMDLLDTYREMCSDLRDYYMSSVSNRMNEIMKVLTVIATIFIPLSFIAGVYGMNFNTRLPGNMPELNWPYGYVFALALMGVIGLGLLLFIWRKGWLVPDDRPNRR